MIEDNPKDVEWFLEQFLKEDNISFSVYLLYIRAYTQYIFSIQKFNVL